MDVPQDDAKQYMSAVVRDGEEEGWLVDFDLLILSFATGIQDAISYPDYRCFASNQTGNTVLLAVAAAGETELFDTRNICTSLFVFLGGCFVMGQIGNLIGPRKRLWLVATNLLSTVLVFATAGIQYSGPVLASGPKALGAISLLAFSSAAQVAMARPLNVPQITTAMATAAWVDLLVDAKFAKRDNKKRNKRFAFLMMLTVGSFVGAFARDRVNSALALVLCGSLKAVATALFFFLPPIEEYRC